MVPATVGPRLLPVGRIEVTVATVVVGTGAVVTIATVALLLPLMAALQLWCDCVAHTGRRRTGDWTDGRDCNTVVSP